MQFETLLFQRKLPACRCVWQMPLRTEGQKGFETDFVSPRRQLAQFFRICIWNKARADLLKAVFSLHTLKQGPGSCSAALPPCRQTAHPALPAGASQFSRHPSQVKNSDTAQYTSSAAITVLTTLACLENSQRKVDPKADQQTVNKKPMNANSMAKPNSGAICPL